MSSLKFLTVGDVIAIHEQVMNASNQQGTDLVRPKGLEAAVHSARNLTWCENAGAAAITVHLAIHIALAHPWVDGNKRTAATAGILFARYNGACHMTSETALEFGRILVRYIESDPVARKTVLEEFVRFVEGWFD